MKKYNLSGTLKNPKDPRIIKLAQVQSPVKIPKSYKTNISFIPVMDQKKLGACVGHAHALVHAYNEYKETGKVKKFSPRYLYALAKKLDGVSGEGTYPIVVAKIQTEKGCATEDTVINNTDLSHEEYIKIEETEKIKEDAYPYRVKGYAEVQNNIDALKQAIYQNGVVAITISVGNYGTNIKSGEDGLHRVIAYGYNSSDKFYIRNTWGKKWGNNGDGYFKWRTQELTDMMVFTDIPNEILEKAKALPVVKLTRALNGAKPTIGTAIASKDGNILTFKTLELPWANNARNKSCITMGTYQCKYEYSERYKCGIYRIKNVLGRSGILIHPGNWAKDTEGCILPGMTSSETSVSESRKALDKLCTLMGKSDFTLIIK